MFCHPDDLGKLRMSSGWHSTLSISHPDEILPIAKSSRRLREQLSFICHPDDLLHRQWVYWLMHMILGLARTLDLHITGPLWGNQPVMRLFEADTALSWDWTSCWSINQGAGEFRSCGTPVTSMLYHIETSNNQRYVRRLEICGDGNAVNFMKCSSFSAPISFGQLTVKSVTKKVFKLSIYPFHWYRMGIWDTFLRVKWSHGHTYIGMDD